MINFVSPDKHHMRRNHPGTVSWVYRCVAGFLLGLAVMSNGARAEGLATGANQLVGERPHPSGEPTLVTIDVYVFGIDEINDVRQQFDIDMFFRITWRDPRLALPEDQRAGRTRIFPQDQVWMPKGLIVNDRGLELQLPQVVDVDDLGNVRYRQRVTGMLAFESQLSEFPFDVQRLPIEFVSYAYAPDEVRFSRDSRVLADVSAVKTEGWDFRLLEPEFADFSIPAADTVRPRLNFLIEAQRDSRYYLLTLFMPMSLIIFMSWTVFWLQPEIVPSRIGISTASIFSLIAFGFSIRLSLPRVSYMTRADIFVIGCTFMVFLALAVAVIGSRWASAGHMDRAVRLNAIARWAYVGLFGLVVTAALTL